MSRATCLSVFIASMLTLATTASLSAQDKPLLSDEIRAVMERDGAQAAQQRFNEIFPGHKDEYTIDMEGLAAIAQERAQAGDYQAAQAISTMAAAIAQDMLAARGLGGGAATPTPTPAPSQRPSEPSRSQPANRRDAPSVRDVMGEPRSDLQRFVGMYGDPAQQGGTPHNLYAAVRCDGYLVIGATWGDAQRWDMRSTSDLAFEAELFGGRMVHVTFQMASDGTPESLTHDVEGLDSPLQYVGPLPEGFGGKCLQPPMR